MKISTINESNLIEINEKEFALIRMCELIYIENNTDNYFLL